MSALFTAIRRRIQMDEPLLDGLRYVIGRLRRQLADAACDVVVERWEPEELRPIIVNTARQQLAGAEEASRPMWTDLLSALVEPWCAARHYRALLHFDLIAEPLGTPAAGGAEPVSMTIARYLMMREMEAATPMRGARPPPVQLAWPGPARSIYTAARDDPDPPLDAV